MRKILLLLLFPCWLSAQVELTAEDSLALLEMMDTAALDETAVDEEMYEMYTPAEITPLAMQEVSPEKWDKAIGEIDYSKDLPQAPRERKVRNPQEPAPDFDWTSWTKGIGGFLQALAVLFAIAMIAFGIYSMLQAPKNRIISKDGTEITLANLDAYIHETDLERFLREALENANWPLAVRLYFLQSIKQLSEKDAIAWSKEKTNRDYLREMRAHPLSTQFRDLTRQYERVWYGNQPITAAEFAKMELEFKAFLSQI